MLQGAYRDKSKHISPERRSLPLKGLQFKCKNTGEEATIVIQTGLRSIAARNEFRRRRRNWAATTIQGVLEAIRISYAGYPTK
ncbi:hypothetical protein AgCh_009825 [Apium graveolens]